jgi:glycine/D-amino acid oxidase-like deaminating enzyme
LVARENIEAPLDGQKLSTFHFLLQQLIYADDRGYAFAPALSREVLALARGCHPEVTLVHSREMHRAREAGGKRNLRNGETCLAQQDPGTLQPNQHISPVNRGAEMPGKQPLELPQRDACGGCRNYNAMVSQRGVLNAYHSDAQCDAFGRRGNAMRLAGADAEILDAEAVRRMLPLLDFDNARFPIRGGLLQRRGGTARHDAVV